MSDHDYAFTDTSSYSDDETRWAEEQAAEARWEKHQRMLDDRDRDLPYLSNRAAVEAKAAT